MAFSREKERRDLLARQTKLDAGIAARRGSTDQLGYINQPKYTGNFPDRGFSNKARTIKANNNPGERLFYPLVDRDECPAKIIFSVIPNVTTSITGATKQILGQTATGIKQIEESATRYSQGTGEFAVLEDNAQDPSEVNQLNLASQQKRKKLSEKIAEYVALYGKVAEDPAYDDSRDKTSHQVHLYLPQAIQVTDGVTYNTNMQLGFIGGLAEKAMQDGVSVAGRVMGGAAGAVVAEANAFTNPSKIGSGMADVLAQRRLQATTISKTAQAAGFGMEAATQVTTNKNTRTFFQDVPMRSFGFGFSLIPTSQGEASEIEKIIKLFRTELYPETIAVDGIRLGYKFPNRFQIKMKYNRNSGRGNDINLKFLPVYMTSFSATYNPNSPMLHADGKWNQVDIQMQFTETRPISKADVRDGGY
jgi:hypothetical protein